jgi:hypothetical protein
MVINPQNHTCTKDAADPSQGKAVRHLRALVFVKQFAFSVAEIGHWEQIIFGGAKDQQRLDMLCYTLFPPTPKALGGKMRCKKRRFSELSRRRV